MKERIRGFKVGKKLKYAFSVIMVAFVIAIIIAIVGISLINGRMTTFYQESYANTKLQLEIRKDVQMVGKCVLWSLTTEDLAETQEKIDMANTYSGTVASNIEALKENFDDKEMVAELDAAAASLKEVRLRVMDYAAVNENEKALELFNGEYNEETENLQNILVRIGELSDEEASGSYNQARLLGVISEFFMVFIGVLSITLCIKLAAIITASICEPIGELEKAASKLKIGELDVDISYESQDELGALAENFRVACGQMREVIEDAGYLLGAMAEGNFNIKTRIGEKYVGNFQLLIDSMRTLNRQLDGTLRQIDEASDQVAIGSGQMAESAQALAEGATDQAGAIEELTATVENVTNLSESGAEAAQDAANRISTAAKEAEKSRAEMQELTTAMDRISITSKEIENIIGAIENIASQTNLLSLNASIEAARAGEAGKGFAVVADQIGKLAADSAQSAVTTRELIGKSLGEIENGNQITMRTAEVITGVLTSMSEFAQIAAGSAEASRTQTDMLKQVEAGIEQISTVVQNNSATAEETSAVSEELSAQAETLKQMVEKFELRED